MNWSKTAWQKAMPVYQAITEMPFLAGLMDGSLAIDKFQQYIAQDSKYLEQFGRALALIGARCHNLAHVLEFLRFAEGALIVENELHASYFKDFDIPKGINLSPSCHHYTSFLLKEAVLAPLEVAMAAVLPCFWIYKEVGDYIYANQQAGQNPYQSWIDTYSGEAFGLLVDKAIHLCDEAAALCTPEQQERMTESFLYACQLEWMFWDSAWRLEEWPVAENALISQS